MIVIIVIGSVAGTFLYDNEFSSGLGRSTAEQGLEDSAGADVAPGRVIIIQ